MSPSINFADLKYSHEIILYPEFSASFINENLEKWNVDGLLFMDSNKILEFSQFGTSRNKIPSLFKKFFNLSSTNFGFKTCSKTCDDQIMSNFWLVSKSSIIPTSQTFFPIFLFINSTFLLSGSSPCTSNPKLLNQNNTCPGPDPTSSIFFC